MPNKLNEEKLTPALTARMSYEIELAKFQCSQLEATLRSIATHMNIVGCEPESVEAMRQVADHIHKINKSIGGAE